MLSQKPEAQGWGVWKSSAKFDRGKIKEDYSTALARIFASQHHCYATDKLCRGKMTDPSLTDPFIHIYVLSAPFTQNLLTKKRFFIFTNYILYND